MSDKNIIYLDRLRKLMDTVSARQIIADDIGCDVSLVTKHYNGQRTVTMEHLVKYAKYFNVSTDYLLGLTKTPVKLNDESENALRISCDYTGLSEETISFFAFNKSISNDVNFNEHLIEFFEFFVSKVSSKSSLSIEIANIRENTTVYTDILMEILEERKNPNPIDAITDDDIKKAISDIIQKRKKLQETIELIREGTNASKYVVSKYLNALIDDFSVSNISNFTFSDLEQLENEYYKRLPDNEQ